MTNNAGGTTAPDATRALAWVALSYVLGIGAGWLSALPFAEHGLLFQSGVAVAVATVVVYLFSVVFSNSSFYDPFWSIQPMALAVAWAWAGGTVTDNLRVMAVVLLMNLYGLRLTYNWIRGWTGLGHEDWRYVMLREQSGAAWQLTNFFGIHLFPSVQVFLGCIGGYYAITRTGAPLNVIDVLAFAVTLGAILLEAISDQQLWLFRQSSEPGQVMDRGVWAHCRHPNYVGEMLVWWGLALFGLAAAPGEAVWGFVGPATITLMFVTISIPMIEKRHFARRAAYAEYARRVPMIVPRLRAAPRSTAA